MSEIIEEELKVNIDGQELVCFASHLPYAVKAGNIYEAEIIPMVFDEYFVEKSDEVTPSIRSCGIAYSYIVTGILRKGSVDCGKLTFFDDALIEDFGFLEGQMVNWKIDRLDLSFI
ncbi:hypothetical protein [Xanthomonas euvesicatoria]|uniref:hypothetical protein n=1 Tax=Xanthomonas euvesicatoria TaxID=456327 RepID=UPI001C460D37|nr:hypothetical protein [Xanthomonas euvesicatoria]MBV6885116.1 hypothetical protein [Xanthomonas campestris pv. euphorbiae]